MNGISVRLVVVYDVLYYNTILMSGSNLEVRIQNVRKKKKTLFFCLQCANRQA